MSLVIKNLLLLNNYNILCDVILIKGDGTMIRTAIIFFYIANEGLSILENSVALGLPVPEKLKVILKQFKEEK